MRNDNISRQAALDAVSKWFVEVFVFMDSDRTADIFKQLRDLPSIDRYGEWKEDKTGNGFWVCSSCGFVSEASGAWLLYKYCPNCGADMRGEGMTREEAKSFWQIRYENAKDFSDPNWEAQERREHREYVEALRMAIEALSADRKGHWIYHENDMCCVRWDKWECSECHERVENKSDYCPHCGADMRSK